MELYELCKALFLDWLLFGIIEAYIFCLFFEKVGGSEKFNIVEILILSVVNSIVSTIIPPVLFQCFGIVYMGCLICYKNKNMNFNYFLISLMSTMFLFVVEIVYFIFMNFIPFLQFEMSEYSTLHILLVTIVKSIEIIFILNFKKWWYKL